MATKKIAAVSFAGGPGPRIGTLALEWPLEVDGVRLEQIELRRLTGADMVALQDIATREGFDDAELFALVCDQPAAVLRALDQDDWLTLKEKVLDFLPRRFREAAESLMRAPAA
jgi:hypothetical protein